MNMETRNEYIITTNSISAKKFFRRRCNNYNKNYLFIDKSKLQAKLIIDDEILISINTLIINKVFDLEGRTFKNSYLYIDKNIINNEDIFKEVDLRNEGIKEMIFF